MSNVKIKNKLSNLHSRKFKDLGMTDRVGKNTHLRLLLSENQNSLNRNSDSATEMFTEEEIPTELAAEMERFNVPPDVGKGLEALPTNKEEVRVNPIFMKYTMIYLSSLQSFFNSKASRQRVRCQYRREVRTGV